MLCIYIKYNMVRVTHLWPLVPLGFSLLFSQSRYLSYYQEARRRVLLVPWRLVFSHCIKDVPKWALEWISLDFGIEY